MKYKIASSVVMSSIGEEAVILDPVQGSYYGLNEVGLWIWSQLNASPKTVEELIKSVHHEFEVSEEDCSRDVQELIKELVTVKLVEVDQ